MRYFLCFLFFFSTTFLFSQPDKPVAIHTSKAVFLYVKGELIVTEKGENRALNRMKKRDYKTMFWMDEGTCTVGDNRHSIVVDLRRGSDFLTTFGRFVLFFDGREGFVFGKSGSLKGSFLLGNKRQERALLFADAKWRKICFDWEGIVYL